MGIYQIILMEPGRLSKEGNALNSAVVKLLLQLVLSAQTTSAFCMNIIIDCSGMVRFIVHWRVLEV